MKELTASYQNDKLEFIKNPVVAEFLGFSQNTDFTESDLEKSILSNLQKFLMELGKGYAFVARQQHIHTEKQDYYIDLVFYNYILKCFVLIDLKTEKITHQDVGQMDMYIRMYDELKRSEGDNPTIGIVLCSDTDDDIARYSVMHGNEQLFASKYKLYLRILYLITEHTDFLVLKPYAGQGREYSPFFLSIHVIRRKKNRAAVFLL